MTQVLPDTVSRTARWPERAATLTIFFALGIAVGAWATALPGLKAGLGLTDRGLSLALLAVSLGSVGATLAAGAFAPRLGTGRATAGAALVLAAVITLPALAPSLPVLAAAALLFGAACGFLDVSMNGHASEVEHRWGAAIMSSFHGAFSLGGLAGATLGGLVATAGAGPVGQLATAAVLVGILTVGAALPLGTGSRSEAHEAGLAWPERAAWGLCAIALFCLMIEGAMADWTAVYLATVVRVTAGAAASGYAAFSIAMVAGRLTGDAIIRRFGARVVIAVGGAVAALGLAISVSAPSFLPATLGFALVGLGLANVAPTVFSAAGRFGKTPSAGMAMVVSLGYAGFISGPPLIGGVASLLDLRAALGLLALVSVAVAVTGLRMRLPPPRASRPPA